MQVLCPEGASGTNTQEWAYNRIKVLLKDNDWRTAYGSYTPIPPGVSTQQLEMTATSSGAFDATQVRAIGLQMYVQDNGGYQGALYVDDVRFPGNPPDSITNSTDHLYDFEEECRAAWWQWKADPEGWNARAWTNGYFAPNSGVAESTALAADAVFRDPAPTNRTGVFRIDFQPALNLSTKDQRQIQAKLRFDPPVEGLLDFVAGVWVHDKVTDQWYVRKLPAGGSGWNTLDFDLDDSSAYTTNGTPPFPSGPMNASSIGAVAVDLYANVPWAGTVFLDDVVIGGRETGTNYNRITTGFVQADGTKFVLDGTNFFFCGANIEYLQTVPDAIVEECLDWAASNGIEVVRTWAMQEGQPYSFQPERGVWNELMFEHLDRIIAMAGHRGIRLMLGLLDNWAHNGGVFQYLGWVTQEHPETVNTNLNVEGVLHHDQFWTNTYCRQWYKDYVLKLLTRTNSITGVVYREDPTIFGLEIVNEPRAETDFAGGTIHEWLHTMSDWVRSIDTNHMLAGGEEGGYVNTYAHADSIPWEVYPNNYYHYGVLGEGDGSCGLHGCGRGHGVDFISDHSSEDTYVEWQGGSPTNRGAIQGEWRPGNSNINFSTIRIYVDQYEYNLWRTNQNSCDQRIEWFNDHWYDSHAIIKKPMILEEFGIHANGWTFGGSYGQIQRARTPAYSQEDRMQVYDLFYNHIEESGIPGSFFWNFGYEGMWNDPFHTCESVDPWSPNISDGAATAVVLSSTHVQEGNHSLELRYNVTTPATNKAIFTCPTNEMWVVRVDETSTDDPPTRGINRGKFIWHIYNPGTQIASALAVRGTSESYWCETPQVSLTSGWNKVVFDLSAGTWAWEGNSWSNESYLIHIYDSNGTNALEDVNEVSLILYDLPDGTGSVYLDNVEIKRDDGLVIYADDPVCAVIREHAARMRSRNVSVSRANTPPAVSNITIVADAFIATPVDVTASDADGDDLSYRLVSRPDRGWVFGTPPSLTYKSQPGTEVDDEFAYVANDGIADSITATVTVHVGSVDVDADHIPDSWEYHHFPKRVQWWPYDANPLTNMSIASDWDGDGIPDYDEYLADTIPTSSSSRLAVTGVAPSSSNGLHVTWEGGVEARQLLQRTEELGDGTSTTWVSIFTNPPPTGTSCDFTDYRDAFRGFYRIKVERP